MKLSTSILLAAQSARAQHEVNSLGCCQYVTVDATSKLSSLDGADYFEYAGKNKHGNHYYQAVTECGAVPKTKYYVAQKKLSGNMQWLFAGRDAPTAKGQARRNVDSSQPNCLEATDGKKYSAVSKSAKDFNPEISCYTPTACPAEEVVVPVCMNQCKAAGDMGSVCNEDETAEAGYSCTCSAGFAAGETACEDVNECLAGTSSCDFNNCMNNEGGYTCAGETAQTYSGVYQTKSGSFENMTLKNFTLLPRPTGSGSDAGGDFEVVDASRVVGAHNEQSIEFFKKYSNGKRERVNFKVTVGASGIAGSHTTFNTDDGSSATGSLTLEIAPDSAAVEAAEMQKPKEYRSVVTAGNGSTIYGGAQVLNTVMEGLVYRPTRSGHGSDEFGNFVDEGVTDTVTNDDGSISYKYNTKYKDFTVEMDCKMDGIEGGAASGSCNYDVIEGADDMNWSGDARTGTMKFGLARETGDGSSKGLIASKEPAAFQYEWDSNNGESTRVTFNCPEFTRFPKYAGDCTSNYGAVTITGDGETPVLPNVEAGVTYEFTEAGFTCNMQDTRTSLGEAVAGKFDISCGAGAPFEGGSGTYGGMAKVGASPDAVSTDKFISTPTNFYYTTTVTGIDGSTKVINKSELGAVLFPKNEGSGEDDYLGAYKSVQLTESNASGVTKQKQLYENGEWAEFAYTTVAVGDSLTFTGDYSDSKGLVGTYVSQVTRDADPITAQYDSMKEESQQIVNTYDSNGNIVDVSEGTVNLNLGEGKPYGSGKSKTFGNFDWTSASEPVIDYSAGTMKMNTRREYDDWHQDYEYNLPFPLGTGVNVFVADVTSGGNVPDGVPASMQVQVVAETKGEFAIEGSSFLAETGPTEADVEYTVDGGATHNLKFSNYQRFAGFNSDGSTKVSGSASSSSLGSVSVIGGDYSTLSDGYYSETFQFGSEKCDVTFYPAGGPAMDESGDYTSNCSKLGNGSWKSAKGQGASLDKYVEEETRVDDVSTRTCGKLEGTNSKCKTRTITGTMTTVYFPRVEGHGTDDYHGKFKRYALADTTFQGENTKMIEYDDGFTTRNVYTLKIVNGKVEESGTWHDSDGTWGTYGYDADVKEVVSTEGSCPAIGQERDEPWVEAWEVKKGCPKPQCPAPMLDITDKWIRSHGRTKKNGVWIKKQKFGLASTIHIPSGFSEWSIGLRFPKNQERGSFQVFNARFENIYNTENEVVVLLTKKWWTKGDLVDGDSFTFIADHLNDQSNPSIMFFPTRLSSRNMNYCFQSNKQQRSGAGSGFEAAVKASNKIKSADDVTRIRMVKGKVTSVAAN
jgi:hypothetical protein